MSRRTLMLLAVLAAFMGVTLAFAGAAVSKQKVCTTKPFTFHVTKTDVEVQYGVDVNADGIVSGTGTSTLDCPSGSPIDGKSIGVTQTLKFKFAGPTGTVTGQRGSVNIVQTPENILIAYVTGKPKGKATCTSRTCKLNVRILATGKPCPEGIRFDERLTVDLVTRRVTSQRAVKVEMYCEDFK